MKFKQLYSSSKGNLYMVTANNGMRLMIECGVAWGKLQEALSYKLGNIAGCLISHEHADHSKAHKEILKAGIDIFASPGTLKALGIQDHRRTFSDFHSLSNRGFHVTAYETIHDAKQPMLFFIRADNENLLFATDTKDIRQHFDKTPFDIVAIECSYDVNVLQHKVDTGLLDQELAKRLLNSHMEVEKTKRYLKKYCNLSRCREIHLLHISTTNTKKHKIAEKFEKEFLIETKVVGM